MKKFTSISHKFFLYSVILLVTILSYLAYSLMRQQSEQDKKILSLASSEIALAEKIINDSIQYTELVIKNMTDQIKKDPGNNKHIENVFRSYQFLYGSRIEDVLSVSMFSWTDKNKILTINSEAGKLKMPIDLSKRDYLQLTTKDPYKLYHGRPVIGGVSNQYIIPAGMGVTDKNGNYQGSIVMGLSINNIYYKFLKEKISTDSGMQILYKKDDNIIKDSFVLEDNYLKNINLEDLNIQILKKPSFLNDSAIIYKKIPNSPYGIILKLDNGILAIGGNNSKLNYLIQIILVFSILIILFFYLRRNFINPILSLSRIIKSISSGDINIAIPQYNSTEINDLAKALYALKEVFIKEQELKSLEIQQIKAERESLAKSNFLKNTSHDLKNHIFAISGLCNLILQNKSPKQIEESEDLKLVKVICSQTIGLQYFLEDLLSDKVTSLGEFSLGEMTNCDVNQIMDEMILLNQNQANNNQITIKKNLDQNLPKLRCDVDRFNQIMMNLIGNALKYSNDNTSVTITTKYLDQQNKIYIEVKDEGIGMTPNEIKMALGGDGIKISKTGLKNSVSSYGFGMKTIKRLVELHNGGLEITSEKNVGTVVGIYFNSSSSNKKIAMETQKQFRILNIDDSKVNLMMTQKRVEAHLPDIKCDIIDNGKDGVELLKNDHGYSLILMDIDMPEMNGIQATENIREFNKTIPIVAFSTRDFDEVKDHIRKEKINDYLSKQANSILFFRSINKWLLNQHDNFSYLGPDLNSEEKLKSFLSGKNVILADDAKTNLMIISKYLRSYNMNVEIAENGKDLVEIYQQNPNKFDLIITDIEMPILRGDEAVKEIRKINKKIPIIAITAHKAKLDIIPLFDIGVDDHFVKGADFKSLINIAATWIKIRNS